jgi:hypothetical protein
LDMLKPSQTMLHKLLLDWCHPSVSRMSSF